MDASEESRVCLHQHLPAGDDAFCAWLKDEGHLTEAVKIEQVPAPVKPVIVFSDADVRAILSFKPKTFTDWRLFAMVQTLLDTGAGSTSCCPSKCRTSTSTTC